jgi:ubiquinone/menaquinone biosynthesis C-methylase UbiE
MTFFNLTKRTRILDVGCGQGRLPIGILSRIGEIEHYRGIDVNKKSIQWCQKHITKRHPTFQFIHLDIKNLRYNPKGNEIDYSYRLPLFDKEFDIIYLYSVFSHMTELDVEVYLKEFHRLLAPSGRLFVTAFIEEGVPDVSINPDNYKTDWNNEPLHCVRYSRSFFNSLLEGSNFSVERFDHATETDGQSAIYALTKEDR